MKKILQVKKQRKVTAPSASLANAGSSGKTRNQQKTLHPLFTWGAAQKVAANQSRLQSLLAQPPPSMPDRNNGARKRRELHDVSKISKLFHLASGDVEGPFVVPGFEEYLFPSRPSVTKTQLCTSQSRVESPLREVDAAENEGTSIRRRSRKSESPSSRSAKAPRLEKLTTRPAAVSPANTGTTLSDQRIPERELSALREIVTNYQVPSIIPCIAEKSPSCTPTHTIQPVITSVSSVDKRVLDWVDNCSQELTRDKDEPARPPANKGQYEETLVSELQKSYLRLVDSEECSDLVVETADRPIRAHKAILFVRCPKVRQVLSSDSSFWQLKWCSSRAALLFLNYIYAADVSFVPDLDRQVRKDLLTLCCQYQTDELAACLIRRRSPSPPRFIQNRDLNTAAEKQSQGLFPRMQDSPGAFPRMQDSLGAFPRMQDSPGTFPRMQDSPGTFPRMQDSPRFDSKEKRGSVCSKSDRKSIPSPSSSSKKTRMSITCETVSITVPEDSRPSIHLSPRLPQSFTSFPQSTPLAPRLDSETKKNSMDRITIQSSDSDLFSDPDDAIVRPQSPLSPLRDSPCREEPKLPMSRKSFSQPNLNAEDSESEAETPRAAQRRSRVIEGLDVTPLPRYSLMKTPEMHRELDRYGIKNGIGKKKAVQLLKHIYHSKHPNNDHEEESESSSSDDDKDAMPLEETMAANPDDAEEEVSENVEEKITRYIKSTPALYDRILRFEPLEVSDFKKELRTNGIRINDKLLLNYLDYHCVNISFGTQRKAARIPTKQRRRKIAKKIPNVAASQP